MTPKEILRRRLLNQQIAETRFKEPAEIVTWLGAMQAQEFAMSKWAIALRLPNDKAGMPVWKDVEIERCFNEGKILRTHLLRPTWHFVAPADIRWVLALTAPRIHTFSSYMYRQLEMDSKTIKRSNDTLAKALEGGKQLTRATLKAALEKENIVADGLRLGYFMMCAELDGVICSGPRIGKQFSYALLDERVPRARKLNRDESLAELAKRYFTGRGPASLQDFAGWSGLTMKDAKTAISFTAEKFMRETFEGLEYFFVPGKIRERADFQHTFLLPDYDEYGMSYKNRDAFMNPAGIAGEKRGGNPVFNHMIVVDGILGGTWQRTIKGNRVLVEAKPFGTLKKTQLRGVAHAVKRYQAFVV